MKVTVITRSEQEVENCDYRNALQIKISDDQVLSFSDGEPEDGNLCRDFSGVYSIPAFLKLAYEAGRNGEDFEIEEVESYDI